ncbi:MAG: RsmB/NOP family class I SAM-dependent RNA methyltransferase [Candidatus Bathyarchaeum tardum]|nr:MAG: RsmB/NOP family class I SAM-dependent RNA methyltransferase [Candidatus Bathyarchaeum tardum]
MLRDAWALAIETLSCIELKRLGERLALTNATKKLKIKDPRAIGLAHRLITETLRKKNYIDHILDIVLVPRSIDEIKLNIRAFLELYVHETKFVDSNLDNASKIAQMGRRILGWSRLNDVEEVLGKILSLNPKKVLNCLEETEKIGLQIYHPTWFVDYCYKLLGRYEALQFLGKSTQIPPVYVRINTLNAPEQKILKTLNEESIILEKVPHLRHAYKLIETKKPLTKTQSFHDGFYYVQDKASCLASEIADPKPGNTILDLCAAPGSKTTYLAQLMENNGTILSVDYSKRRIGVWKRQTKRLGTSIVLPIVADVRNSLPLKFSADVVILDPPCTSTGTFGKTPAAKWRLSKRSILGMSKMQSEMIEEGAQYVKEGGFLTYSTCSITVEENECVIESFLKTNPEFKLVNPKPQIGLPGLRGLTKCQRLYPHIHKCNGFFVAKLQKEIK